MPAYGAAPYLPAIVMERPVYIREMSDGLYTPFTYLLYKVLHRRCLSSLSRRSAAILPGLTARGEHRILDDALLTKISWKSLDHGAVLEMTI